MTYKQESSETIRETSSHIFSFNYYRQYATPQHKPNPEMQFLEWFIGFFEAEGCFLKWPNNKDKTFRFGIEITQKDPKLIYKIRTKLGFGRVTVFTRLTTKGKTTKQSEATYARYYVHDIKNLERIIFLLNGNLVTQQKTQQFHDWLNLLNKQRKRQGKLLYSTNKSQLKIVPYLLKETGWLSGFLEGDGGFWVNSNSIVKTKKNGEKKFVIKMKFYITQEELAIISAIAECFGYHNKCINKLTNGQTSKNYYRFETCSLKMHLELLDYLKKFPFLGKRSIKITRWARLTNYRLYDYPITVKSVRKVQRLIEGTKN